MLYKTEKMPELSNSLSANGGQLALEKKIGKNGNIL